MPQPSPSSPPRRIAVIGSGVAGLSAAWLLSRRHHVTLYEKDGWLGGHARTVDVAGNDGPIAVDTGFIVYNTVNYPNLTALFAHLGVESHPSRMSFAASVGGGSFEYSSASLNRYFGQRRNFLRPRFWRMTRDLLRFYKAAAAMSETPAIADLTLGEYLDREGYSATFAEDHILPMSAAIWSTTPAQIRDYPLAAFLRFYRSHSLLDLKHRPEWRTVSGGSRRYVDKLAAAVAEKRGGAARVERTPLGALVTDRAGRTERYADIVIATHADEALGLLSDPTAEERRILGAFRYTDNEAVLHTDASLMPRNRRVWSSWNFIGDHGDDAGAARPMCVTYWMNNLQGLDPRTPLFVTLNPHREIPAEHVLGRYVCSHPYFDRAALAAQTELWTIQGRHRTWFAGAHFGYGFHEDGLQAGLGVAEAIGGVRRPWLLPAGSERIARVSGPAWAEAAA